LFSCETTILINIFFLKKKDEAKIFIILCSLYKPNIFYIASKRLKYMCCSNRIISNGMWYKL
jgi:hypothetical protein